MDESLTRAKKLTYHLVRVTPQSDGKFAAEPVGATELRVVAATPEEALAQASDKLSHWASALYWVPVAPASPNGSALPPLAGHAKDDPFFDAYLEEIDRYRQEVDKRECSNSSSTPTT